MSLFAPPHFKVVLNEKEIRPREFSGHRIPFMEGTDHGLIHGEIYILPESRPFLDIPYTHMYIYMYIKFRR